MCFRVRREGVTQATEPCWGTRPAVWRLWKSVRGPGAPASLPGHTGTVGTFPCWFRMTGNACTLVIGQPWHVNLVKKNTPAPSACTLTGLTKTSKVALKNLGPSHSRLPPPRCCVTVWKCFNFSVLHFLVRQLISVLTSRTLSQHLRRFFFSRIAKWRP